MMQHQKTAHRSRRWFWVALAITLATIGSFVVWARTPPTPSPEAYLALESVDVIVLQTPWLTFMPLLDTPRTGLIFYPDAHTAPAAYATYAEELALQGYLVVIVPMPINMALLAPDKANEVMAAHTEIDAWAVGGHALGGAMAARFVARNPDAAQGLLLWSAEPAGRDDLSSSGVRVMSILTPAGQLQDARGRLPASAEFVSIAASSHASSAQAQQARAITQSSLHFLASLAPND